MIINNLTYNNFVGLSSRYAYNDKVKFNEFVKNLIPSLTKN